MATSKREATAAGRNLTEHPNQEDMSNMSNKKTETGHERNARTRLHSNIMPAPRNVTGPRKRKLPGFSKPRPAVTRPVARK
jgi:hypothetical protein